VTAINACAIGARGYLLADTAAYTPDGVVRQFVSKVITLPHISTVLATRGAMPSLNLVAIELGKTATSLDDLIERGAEIIREAHEDGDLDYFGNSEREFDLVCVGWSDRNSRAEAHALSSLTHAGSEPYLFARHDLIMAPQPSPSELNAAGLTVGGQFQDFRPARDLLRIMEMQRLKPGATGSDSEIEAHVVGGSAIMTEVTRDSISQRIVQRWPDDRVGERIKPLQHECMERSP
jgi:hypothetical protein